MSSKLKRKIRTSLFAFSFATCAFISACSGSKKDIGITEKEQTPTSVSSLSTKKEGEEVVVEGVFVGITKEKNEVSLILKDIESDNFVLIKDLPDNLKDIDSSPLQKGDLIRFSALIKKEGDFNYLSYNEDSFDASKSKINSSDIIEYSLDNCVEIAKYNDFNTAIDNNKIKPYSIIHFSNTLYYSLINDKYVLHKNIDAVTPSDVKVKNHLFEIDTSSLDYNVGKNWFKRLFGTDINRFSSYYYTDIKNTLNLYAMVLPTADNNYKLSILDTNWIKNDSRNFDLQKAILNVAEAYMYRGTSIRYDQRTERRELGCAPEVAVKNNPIYLDCSAFQHTLYYNVFGRMLFSSGRRRVVGTGTARDELNLDSTPYYFNGINLSESQIAEHIQNFKAALQPGDFILYSNKSGHTFYFGGHVMLYAGNNEIIHCIGGDYYNSTTNFDNRYERNRDDGLTTFETTIGGIQRLSADFLFEKNDTELCFYNQKAGMAVYRPYLLPGYDQNLTDDTMNRFKSPGLTFSKDCSHGYNTAVFNNDLVKYTLHLKNMKSRSITGVTVEDYLPNDVELVSVNSNDIDYTYDASNRKLSLDSKVDIDSFGEYKLEYTVRIKKSEGFINTPSAYVNDIPSNSFQFTVSKLSREDLDLVAQKAYSLEGETLQSNPTIVMKNIYKETLGIDIYSDSYDTVTKMRDSLLDISDKYGPKESSDLYDILVPTMYGGWLYSKCMVDKYYNRSTDSAREINITNLAVGDILYNLDSNADHVFMYLGDRKLLRCSNSTSEQTFSVKYIYDSIYQNELIKMWGSSYFFVLRPSTVFSK